MIALITDPALEEQLIAQRKASGADRYDEVWEGVYVMAPLADNEHQRLVNELATVLTIVIGWPKLGRVFPGVNVSDRQDDWTYNYRCPDVAVFLNGTGAQDCGTHWLGGPDLAVEITSPGDQTEEKLPFYAAVGTRELLVVGRKPWSLTLYSLQTDRLTEAGVSSVEQPVVLSSNAVPLSWQLTTENEQPLIRIAHRDNVQSWQVLGLVQ